MKNFFNFELTGKMIFPYYVWLYLAYIVLCVANVNYQVSVENMTDPSQVFTSEYFLLLGASFLYSLFAMFILFYIYREFVKALSFNGEVLMFEGKFNEYIMLNIKGFLLSIVTLGIYSCWYQRNIVRYIAGNTSYSNRKFKFNGTGGALFVIITAYIVISAILIVLLAFAKHQTFATIAIGIVMYLVFSALIYGINRWYINLSYDNNKIKMVKGGYIAGSLFIAQEIFFAVITLGLYLPAAIIRIDRYFIDRVEVRDEDDVVVATLGCDLNLVDDYLYFLGQMVFTILTFGIYGAWAMCNIYKRILGKSYIK